MINTTKFSSASTVRYINISPVIASEILPARIVRRATIQETVHGHGTAL
jgi:hypothetical protein